MTGFSWPLASRSHSRVSSMPLFRWFLMLSFLVGPNLFAQLPVARLLQLSPPGGKSGGTVEITVSGTGLEELKALLFSHPGLQASYRQSNRFEVTIPASVPPGNYEVRAVGRLGISNPRIFAVGVLSEMAKAKHTAEAPQKVTLESTISGQTDAATVDYFRFPAKQGQRVLVRCDTRALDSKLEPVLALRDGTGREVSRDRQRGLLDYTIPADGDFTVQLHDATYRGGAEYFYRLSIGTFPQIDHAQALGRGADGQTKFALFGRNLPGSKPVEAKATPAIERIEIDLNAGSAGLNTPLSAMPAQVGLDLFEYRARNERGVSEAVLLRFPIGEIVNEMEPNNSPAKAQELKAPCEVSGTLGGHGDRDWFRFVAKKGDVFWIEVIAHRLGQATDPFVLVQQVTTNGAVDVLELNDGDANVGGTECNTAHRDPVGRFEAKQDGAYLLHLRDLFSQPAKNPALVYQLIIRRAAPDFRLAAIPVSPLPINKDAKNIPQTTPTLRRGETLPIRVMALRRDGFDGAIELTASNLPPGVFSPPARIEAGKNSALLFLRANADGAPTNGVFHLAGHGTVAGGNVIRTASIAGLTWNVGDPAADAVTSRASAAGVVSVMDETMPLRVELAEAKPLTATAGAKLKIPLRVLREGEFTSVVKLKAVGAPALDSAKEFDLDPKATNAVYELDLAAQKVAAGRYTFALQGLATGKPMKPGKDGKKTPGKDVTFTLYSMPLELLVTAAPKTNAPAK